MWQGPGKSEHQEWGPIFLINSIGAKASSGFAYTKYEINEWKKANKACQVATSFGKIDEDAKEKSMVSSSEDIVHGKGSTLHATQLVRECLGRMIKKYDVYTMLDVGC